MLVQMGNVLSGLVMLFGIVVNVVIQLFSKNVVVCVRNYILRIKFIKCCGIRVVIIVRLRVLINSLFKFWNKYISMINYGDVSFWVFVNYIFVVVVVKKFREYINMLRVNFIGIERFLFLLFRCV